MTEPLLYGYTDRLSYRPGDPIQVMADTDSERSVDVELVRLRIDNQSNQIGPAIEWSSAGQVSCRPQESCVGSFVAVVDLFDGALPTDLSLGAWIWPTMVAEADHRQGVIGAIDADGLGLALELDGADLILFGASEDGSSAELRLESAVRDRAWYFAYASIAAGTATIGVVPVGDGGAPARVEAEFVGRIPATTLTIGASGARKVELGPGKARGIPINPYNGKIERPFVLERRLGDEDVGAVSSETRAAIPDDVAGAIAVWDFAPTAGAPPLARDVRGGNDGLLVNLPAGGMTGCSWTGEALHYHQRPAEYAALHFHDDEVFDAGWAPILNGEIPSDLPSGAYGVRLSGDGVEDTIPIVVAPKTPTAKVLVVLPTFTYLAYANELLFEEVDPALLTTNPDVAPSKRDLDHAKSLKYGRSLYDHHRDHSGVMFSSARRAILNSRADYKMEWLVGEAGRAFSGDMYLLEWLQRQGIEFDLVTDLEVHLEGEALLALYKVVVTGAHPEYTSEPMLSAFESYRDNGGNFMYLGGNGFYWVTGVISEDPLVIEIRRGHAGIRMWMSEPGEVTLTSTGEPGGLWRYRGRAPQKLAATGFAAQGWDRGRPFVRTPESYDEAVSWIFEGVEGDTIGTAGLVLGAAGSDEIDRVDPSLGTPPQTVVLAKATGFSDFYQRVIEQIYINLPGQGGGETDPEVHADMTYFEVEGGGKVFSASSIGWSGSLLTDDEDPGPSQITLNVLRRFADLKPPAARGPTDVG